MGTIPAKGKLEVDVHLRRSPRARRMSLRVSSLDGRVTLTLPGRVAMREAERFVAEKTDWIMDAVEATLPSVAVMAGTEMPLEGRMLRLVASSGRGVRVDADRMLVPQDRTGIRVEAYLKTLARERLVRATDTHTAALGRNPGRITLRDTRSRWGSCTSRGDLMYSWRLIMAPPEVLDYVAAHEVAHLVHLDHSSAFWDVVDRLCPGHAKPRGWLRREGAALHRYRFRGD